MVWYVKRKNEVVTKRVGGYVTRIRAVLQDDEPIIVGPGSFEILSMSWYKQFL